MVLPARSDAHPGRHRDDHPRRWPVTLWEEHKAALTGQIAGLQTRIDVCATVAADGEAPERNRRAAAAAQQRFADQQGPLRRALHEMNAHEQRAARGEPM